MTGSNDSVSASARATLEKLDAADRSLFLAERERGVADGVSAGPLLDQLCCVRLVMTRLQEGYAVALASFEERLAERSAKSEGWRQATRKYAGEYESPMPWMHPFRLAREDLGPLEEELCGALKSGETAERDPDRLARVLERHALALPLPSPIVEPRFLPGGRHEG